jgi:hypothetical protein
MEIFLHRVTGAIRSDSQNYIFENEIKVMKAYAKEIIDDLGYK